MFPELQFIYVHVSTELQLIYVRVSMGANNYSIFKTRINWNDFLFECFIISIGRSIVDFESNRT